MCVEISTKYLKSQIPNLLVTTTGDQQDPKTGHEKKQIEPMLITYDTKYAAS